ncbi:spore coat U domain-containing protein [Tsuneonella sp. YG55]|uniref:Spore coat U domain-containing protein n=1 Tax=Tsuneonella litorea TaxID=2976475 RepID=A0A9X2W2B3_9SPHN|nr:spore coat U domain-containing protein [Tsuneonella litorea]MCT2559767.1 spore coat U domain-containing protein [Tsuneonella litorea]
MQRLAIIAVAVATAGTTAAAPAWAGQVSATMPVTLTVQPACRVSATPMAFAGTGGATIDAESRIAVDCNGDIPLSITLDGGAHAAGGERRLASGGGGYVSYVLYSDAGRRMPWLPGQPVAATARGGRLEMAAYGRVDPSATRGADGEYADIVAITVEF